jgi:hypothetical protein
MCIGRKVSTPAPPRVDPAPTTVQASDVQAEGGSGDKERREQERRKRAATAIAQDRDTILGAAPSGRNTMG